MPLQKGGGGEAFATLWVTQKAPADFSWDADRSGQRKSFAPQNGGNYLLVVEFPLVGPDVDKLPMDTMMKVVGAAAPKRGAPPSNPLMHRTRSVDYAIIMSGEIDMLLDTGRCTSRPATSSFNRPRITRGSITARSRAALLSS